MSAKQERHEVFRSFLRHCVALRCIYWKRVVTLPLSSPVPSDFNFSQQSEIRMDEGDMYESEVITFVAPKKSGWLKKKSKGEGGGERPQTLNAIPSMRNARKRSLLLWRHVELAVFIVN